MKLSHSRFHRHWAVVGGCVGAFATALQVSVSRELLGLWGGSELVVALALVLWLLGLSIAALLAHRVEPWLGLRAAAIAAGPAAVGVLLAIRLCPRFSGIPPGGEPSLSFLLGMLALSAAPAGGLVGFAFTSTARLVTNSGGATGVYIAEAVGSLIAGAAFSLVFTGTVPHLVLTAGCAALLLGAVFPWGLDRSWAFSAMGSVLMIAAFVWGGWWLESWSTAMAAPEEATIVAAGETPYARAVITERLGERQLYLDGRVSDTFPEPYDKPLDVHLALLQRRSPNSFLVLGAGPTDRVEAALSHGLAKIVFVEMDAFLLRFLKPLWPASTRQALEDSRVSLVHADGRVFLAQTRERFDAILLRTGPPRCLAVARYHTVEAFVAAQRALAPGGVLTVLVEGAASHPSLSTASAARAELAALRQVFPRVEVAAGDMLVIHAGRKDSELSVSGDELSLRLQARGIRQGLDEVTLADVYDRRRAREFLDIADVGPGRAGRDLRPTAHLWALAQWAELWHGQSPRHWLGWSAVGAIAALCLAAFVVFLAARSQGYRRRGAILGLAALASTGLCGMSLQIVSLLVYQVGSGALYRGLSLLLGLFMAGLAAGAWLGEAAAKRDTHRAVWLCELSTLAVCLGSAWVLPLGATHSWVVLAWSPILGMVTGLAFPVFLAWCRVDASTPEPVAAVTAADHAGAAVGALLTGLFLLPLLGVTGTALALALQKALIAVPMLRRDGP